MNEKSYRRKCKRCGRFIQLRRMPAGQWVAFEGYDTPHDCNTPPKNRTELPIKSNAESQERKSGYEDLDFINVSDSGMGDHSSTSTSTSTGRQTGQAVAGSRQQSAVTRKDTAFTPRRVLTSVSTGRQTRQTVTGLRQQSVSEIQHLIDQAILNHRVLRITFTDLKGEVTERDVEPILREQDYCTAYCRLRNDFRRFRLDGIKAAFIKEISFTPRHVPNNSIDYSTKKQKRSGSIPAWVWWVVGFIILYIIAKI
jgi:hypothetical protein